ncbi:MAG TPA: NTP transferase domain-containing protein [Sphingomonadaceae bacterium]|nr:NTP transferase domain-containing protein [Sphingomonadaceae bacterium]
MTTVPPITALVAAGQRPEGDPLAIASGVADKALIELEGRPMLAHVLETLLGFPGIGAIRVLTQTPERLRAHPAVAALAANPRIRFVTGGDSVSEAVAAAMAPGDYPFLLTTADHPLLDAAMLEHFTASARAANADVAAAVVSRAVFTPRFPAIRRTWLRFAGGAYSGANLFWFGSPAALAVLARWRSVEQQRKRARAVVGAFGPLILLGVVTRLLSLDRALAMAGRRLGLNAVAIELPQAEACIDVDRPADRTVASAILAERARENQVHH